MANEGNSWLVKSLLENGLKGGKSAELKKTFENVLADNKADFGLANFPIDSNFYFGHSLDRKIITTMDDSGIDIFELLENQNMTDYLEPVDRLQDAKNLLCQRFYEYLTGDILKAIEEYLPKELRVEVDFSDPNDEVTEIVFEQYEFATKKFFGESEIGRQITWEIVDNDVRRSLDTEKNFNGNTEIPPRKVKIFWWSAIKSQITLPLWNKVSTEFEKIKI